MRIAFVSSFREDSIGGEGVIAIELAQELARQGHDVVFICPGEATTTYRNDEGLRIHQVACSGEGEVVVPNLSPENMAALEQFLGGFQPDVVHSHTYILLGAVLQVWAVEHGIPFIYTAHELPTRSQDFAKGFHGGYLLRATPLYQVIIRDFYRNCTRVVALNQPAYADIRTIVSDHRIVQIPNGRDQQRLNAQPFADPTTPERHLIFTGHIMPRKNQLFLVRMMQHLPETYHLRLVGLHGHENYVAEVEALIAKHKLRDRVALPGPVPRNAIPGLLSQAHLFVSASTREVQSLAVIEALASGTPVVGLANETITELVDESNGRCLETKTTPQAFAEAVRAVAEAPQYHQICACARERVQYFDLPQVAERTVALYKDVCAHPPVPRRVPHLTQQIVSMTRQFTRIAHLGWQLQQK